MNFNTKVTLSYYAEGTRNDLGEPSRTLTTRESNVPCRLETRSPLIRFEFPDLNRRTDAQGIEEVPTMLAFFKRSQTVENGDVLTDADGNVFIIARVVNKGNSHKEAILATHNTP